MSILADRGLVRPLRPVPAVRPAEGGAASDGPVPVRREPGSGGPARRSRRRAGRVDATRKDGVPEGSEAESGADPGSASGSAEVVELRGRAGARRGPGADRPGEGSRGEPGRRRAWQAATEAGLAGGELPDAGWPAPGEAFGRNSARPVRESARFSPSAERGARAAATEVAEPRSAGAVRSVERAGFRTSAPSAVETEEAPARKPREARGRTAVRHLPAVVPANPGRTARERRGEPLRPPSRERVVAGRRGGVACKTAARPSVRWPWLFAIAFAACLIVTGLGVFGAGVSSGPVPSRTASVSVQPGDSLGALAARFAPNADQSAVVERIKELNNLDDTALMPGMPLTVPVAWSGAGSSGESGGRSDTTGS